MAKARRKKSRASSDPQSTADATRRGRRHSASTSAQSLAPNVPGWVPPVLFGVLTLFLFREFVFSDQMLFGSDTLGLGYVARALYADALSELGRVPGWAPHILGGTPFIEALSGGDALYPPSVLLLMLTEPYRALGWKLVLHVFLAGLFMFGWIRSLGGSRGAALFAGTAYLLAPFFVSFVRPGHDGKMFVMALAPLLFWAVQRHFERPRVVSVAAIGLTVALVMYTTHFQMAYFLFGGVGLFAGFRAFQIARGDTSETETSIEGSAEDDDLRQPAAPGAGPRTRTATLRFALFLLGAVLGATGAAYQFVPAAQYVTESSRRIQTTRAQAGETGRAWSSSFSLNPEEVMSLVVPEFPGNGAGGSEWTDRTYWGRNGLKDNHEYTGLVVLLLAALGFLAPKARSLRRFLVGLGLLALLFGLGTHTPVWGLFYALIPGINLFRAPGMVIFLFGFSAITLAAVGLDRAFELARRPADGADRALRVLQVATGVVAGIAILLASGIFTSIWTGIVYRSISDPQQALLASHLPNIVRGAWIAVAVAGATLGIMWGLLTARLSPRLALAALITVVAVDEARVDASFIQTFDFYRWSQADPNVRTILDRERGADPYRLFSLVGRGQDVSPALHGIELAAGHHPNDLSRYRELIGMVGSQRPTNLDHPNIRRILNVEYILWPDYELGPAPQLPVLSRTELAAGQPYQTLLADVGLPRARLVSQAVVKGDAEAVPYIMSEAHDPTVEAVLAEPLEAPLPGGTPAGRVTWITREADRLELSVESDRAALLVIGDNWYPAWRATVNGEAAPVLRAYHTLRAVPVPAGASTVEMHYASTSLAQTLPVSLAVLLGLLTAAVVGTLRDRRKDGSGEAGQGEHPTGNIPAEAIP